jgi:hypothetical protein
MLDVLLSTVSYIVRLKSKAVRMCLPAVLIKPIICRFKLTPFASLVWTFFALAALDIAANAAAGPAAVATAAHVNGSPLTARAMQVAALAGITKSGVLAFVEFAGFAGLPTPAWILLVLVASSFGICVLITAEVSNLILGESE